MIGGAERILLAAIRGVRENIPDARIRLILFSDGPLMTEAEKLGVEVRVIKLPLHLSRLGDFQLRDRSRFYALFLFGWTSLAGIPSMVKFVGCLRDELRRQKPNLIHSNGLKAHALVALARPKKVPILWHIHDFLGNRRAMGRILRRFSRGVAGGIAISSAVQQDAQAVLPGLPIRVVHNAVDTTHFTPEIRDGALLDQLAGLAPAEPRTLRVGLIATYARWKGQDVFLEALNRLASEIPPVRGYIVGGAIYKTLGSQFTQNELLEMVAKLGLTGRVGLVPFLADPVDAYRMLDVVVHASTRPEPFGLTIIEAMACGRPVIVAAAGGASELVRYGQDGLHHVPGDATDLARVIAQLASDPDLRVKLGHHAREVAVSRYDQIRFSRQIAAIHSEFIGVDHSFT